MMNAFADGATVAVRPGFAEAMGLRLVAGRWLSNEEFATGAPVAVMSSRAAAKVFGSESAVGRQIKGFVNQKPQPFDVVGVVQDPQLGHWDDQRLGQVFAPYAVASDEQTSVSVVVRAERPDQTMALLLPMVQRRDAPDVRVISAAMAADLLNESVRPRRLNSWLFGGFAASALAIVGVGILGLLAMSATKRTREIGIRMAMGSTPTQVVQLLLKEQLFAVVTGLVAGGIVAAWALRFVRIYLFKMDGSDPRVWAVAVFVMLAVALIGAAIPSVRASRIDPSRALRGE
jgi:ABC-type antimicrobial peptide transport system permease subunit